MWPGATGALALVALLVAPSLAGQGNGQRLDIRLANVRWQALPPDVERVCVGPDGRCWHLRKRYRTVPSLKPVLEQIEREFRQEAPQIKDADLLLFEPGGRVWFYVANLRTADGLSLLGYDGRAWVKYTIDIDSQLCCGHRMTRGSFVDSASHRYAGDAAWFIGGRDVFRFDGKNWLRQCVVAEPQQPMGLVRLAVSPDGQTAATWQRNGRSIWIFQHNRWCDEPLELANASEQVLDAVITDSRTLCVLDQRGLKWLSLDGKNQRDPDATPIGEQVQKKLRALANDRYEVWQRASADLKALGPNIRPQLEQALREASPADPQYRLKLHYRLRLVLQDLSPAPPTQLGPSRVAIFGSARVSNIRWLCQDSMGRIWVLARHIEDDQSRTGAGLAILDAANHTKVVWISDLDRYFASLGGAAPILTATANRVWWPNIGPEGRTQLLDLDRGKFVEAVPGPNRITLGAVTADGRLFLSSGWTASGLSCMTVYSPRAPDARLSLPIERVPLKIASAALADDGAIWAVHRDQGLVRFDGRRWQPLAEQPTGEIRGITAGQDGVAIIRTNDKAFLYRADQKIASDAMPSLLKQQRATIRRAFASGESIFEDQNHPPPDWRLAVDRAGNIWSTDGPAGLSVLIGDLWQSLPKVGDADGTLSSISCLTPIGNGQKVCIAGIRGNQWQLGFHFFFGEVKDGKVVISPALQGGALTLRTIRDAERCLWISGGIGSGGGSYTSTLFRLGPEGVNEKHATSAQPCLADGAGNVWFDQLSPYSSDSFRTWQGGRFTGEIPIPGFHRGTLMVSDRPGSVYAATCMGLQHLSAKGPRFDHFRLGKVYSIDDVAGEIVGFKCSTQGRLVLTTHSYGATQSFSLYTSCVADREPKGRCRTIGSRTNHRTVNGLPVPQLADH